MSEFSRADYSELLVGKTIKRVHWINDAQGKCLPWNSPIRLFVRSGLN